MQPWNEYHNTGTNNTSILMQGYWLMEKKRCSVHFLHTQTHSHTGVSIISKNWVFYKGWYDTQPKVVFFSNQHWMWYLLLFNISSSPLLLGLLAALLWFLNLDLPLLSSLTSSCTGTQVLPECVFSLHWVIIPTSLAKVFLHRVLAGKHLWAYFTLYLQECKLSNT